VLTVDRFWSVYLGNKLKIKRNKLSLTILMLIIFGFLFLTNGVNFFTYANFFSIRIPNVINGVLVNFTILSGSTCTQLSDWNVVQQLEFSLMRSIVPFVIMVILNVLLIKHIAESRKRIAQNRSQKRENHFTIAVTLMNGAFFVTNFPRFVTTIMNITFTYSGLPPTEDPNLLNAQLSVFYTTCIIFSLVFTLAQFWLDLTLNSLFRKEVIDLFLRIARRNQVSVTESNTREQPHGQSNKNNNTALSKTANPHSNIQPNQPSTFN
jgi:hypothetical protein